MENVVGTLKLMLIQHHYPENEKHFVVENVSSIEASCIKLYAYIPIGYY